MATQESLDRVQQLYVAYYGRPAEQAGQEYWATRIDEEGEGAIINAFGNSAEYTERFGDQSNADAINTLYQQMFGRDAEPNGLAYWVGVLNSGEKTLAEIATTILNAASGQDRQVLNAKVAAAAEYTAEFGSAEDYDLETAIGVVTDADGGIYIPTLTDAIETLLAAEQALADFLVEADGDDDEDTSATPTELRTALADAEAALQDDVQNNGGSNNQLNANLQDAEAQLASVRAEIAGVPGLRKAIADYQAAQVAAEEAQEEFDEAESVLDGRETTFANRNDGVLAVDRTDGTATFDGNVILELNDGELVVAEGVELIGINALLADVQAYLAAAETLDEANTAETNALAVVNGIAGGADLLSDLEDALADVETAEDAIEARAELQADVDAAQALVDQLDELEGDIEDAEEAIADLGVDLNGVDATNLEDDLFIFNAEEGTTTGGVITFSFEGEDLFFIGNAFSRVDLDENDDVLTTGSFGEAGVLEVFFQQVGADTVLSFESQAFQGNATNGFEGDVITLTGVNAEDLQLENGYISIA